MPDVMKKALDERKHLADELAGLEGAALTVRQRIAGLDTFLEEYTRLTGVTGRAEGSLPPPRMAAAGMVDVHRTMRVSINPRRPLKPGTTAARIAGCAASAIREKGRPLSISDLLLAVREANYTVGGERPTTNLSSILSRSSVVQYEHGIGWDLVPDPQEPSSDDKRGTQDTS